MNHIVSLLPHSYHFVAVPQSLTRLGTWGASMSGLLLMVVPIKLTRASVY